MKRCSFIISLFICSMIVACLSCKKDGSLIYENVDIKEFMAKSQKDDKYHCLIPVSYTHLDVYKRQIRNFLVQGTYMSGQLPREFGLFKNLNTPLVLLGNQFSGYLPKEFSSIKRGVFLLDNNISSIEWEFFDIPRDKAWEVVMKNNKLVGEIPEYVFKTEYWQDFSYNFTIQKEGYGFSNFRDGL